MSLRQQRNITKSVLISLLLLVPNVATSLAKTDWRKDIGTFRVGIITDGNVERSVARVEPFRLAIAEALGLNVEIIATKNYRTLIDRLATARIEYAIFSASAYAAVWHKCECIEPLVLPKSANGTDSYKSIIISATDGPDAVSGLANARLAALSKSSFAGYLFAAYELKHQGVALPEEIKFADSGETAIGQFLNGEHDALIGWSSLSGDPVTGYSHGTLRLIAEKNDGKSTPYRIIWRSSAIPHRPHVIKKSLPGEVKVILRETLVHMYDADPVAYDAIEPVYDGGFIAARHQQFLPIINYVDSLRPKKKKDTTSVDKPPAD